ncbi:P-loop containing nucleoside triphosphate hydrolase protein [Hyaloscypha variabilis]
MTSNKSTKTDGSKLDGPIVIAFGLIGAGKSTYMNNITGASLPVSDDLHSCTKTAEATLAMIEGVDVTLVDTAGFNDPERSDAEILHSTATLIAENLDGHER